MAEHIILFVEGDTDEVLFKKIIARYKELANYESNIICHIDNLKGVSKYTSKAKGRLRNYYLKHIRKNKGSLKFVFCSYDTDVFEFQANPPINWPNLKKEMQGIVGKGKVIQIPVKTCIEDWLLSDLSGLCRYLKIKDIPKKLTGKDAYMKISNLFEKKGKVYSKGYDAENIVQKINIDIILDKQKEALKPLRDLFIKDN